MPNLTLAVDDTTLRRARIRALERGTSVNALVRDFLQRLAGDGTAAAGMADFLAVTGAARGDRTWTRGDLHDRRD